MAYTIVTSEGGLFPSDMLDRIASGDAEGQRAADFGLDGGRRLIDETQSAFADARSFWDAFQRRRQRSRESVTTLTREDWMVPFLELLGFDHLVPQRASAEAGGETFFISHRAGDDPDAPPVHIVSLEEDLDKRGATGRRSPHGAVQEYLNRADALWGLTTNGRRLRLLRDTTRFSKPTYLEFDIEGMIEGNLYSEFVLLYRLLHESRFPRDAASAHECLLSRYYEQGIDEGSRVRDKLRDGVQEALKVLGTAFLAHPDSHALRERVEAGGLDDHGYYRQLLRLVYRLLFLMVAEERRLIFPPDEEDISRHAIYEKYYSVSHLRQRCERYFASDSYSDLWQGLTVTFRLFRDDDLARKLGLRALNGELFGPSACADLENASCTNEQLLIAIRHLSTFIDEGPGRRRRRGTGLRRRVNYGDINVEEFGSVYESLLEYRPQVTNDPPAFDLVTGSERKQTGSYYTPPELVRELIDSALVPVVEERLAKAKTKEEKEQALLSMKVCDPAAGSGHFLLAAARRIARELAKVRLGEDEPAPSQYREAVRDVIRSCIYAVDKNPLAVDLCKVALWMEGHSAGLPLSFLDHHVKCGDSLVGVFDLDVLTDGIPDDAYKPVTGDDKHVASAIRKRNKAERQGQLGLAPVDVAGAPANLAVQFAELARREERAPDDVHAKEQLYERLRAQGSEWWKYKVACDLWTAAFFTPLRPTDGAQPDLVPTTDTVRRFLAQPDAAHGQVVGSGVGLAGKQRFFHWPLEFPDVFAAGGFDVVLGNPPFMGGRKITEHFGSSYAGYLSASVFAWRGSADLCACFIRKAYDLLRNGGHLGMLATNTIGQGDTRQAGLAAIVAAGGAIGFARRFVQWPGAANVEVNILGIRKGAWPDERLLDGEYASRISSRLDQELEAEVERLKSNKDKAFQGSILLGKGFILQGDEALSLISQDFRNRDCLFPYLTGEDINSRPDQSPSRWVIQFDERSEAEARSYPDLWQIVEEKVRLERLGKDASKYPRMVHEWWKYWNNRRELYRACSGLERVLARSRVSELHMLVFLPTGIVYSDATVVFAFEDYFHFAVLQSSVHETWLRRQASTMRTDVRYTPTDCFETFAFPNDVKAEDLRAMEDAAKEFYEVRGRVMQSARIGLTKTHNLVNNPDCDQEDILTLRELQASLDQAVVTSYGWSDVRLGHDFHENERGHVRFSLQSEAVRQLLERLQLLNVERARTQSEATSSSPERDRAVVGPEATG